MMIIMLVMIITTIMKIRIVTTTLAMNMTLTITTVFHNLAMPLSFDRYTSDC